MFSSQSNRGRVAPQDGEARQPLLASHELDSFDPDTHTLFSAHDDFDTAHINNGTPATASTRTPRQHGSVRFHDEVQMISPVRQSFDAVGSGGGGGAAGRGGGSTHRQRNVHTDRVVAHPDDPDDAALEDIEREQRSSRSGRRIRPLIQGFSFRTPGGDAVEAAYEPLSGSDTVDLEELAAKQRAGGGLVDSVANMANSILGAGIIGLPYAVAQAGFFTGVVLLFVLCAVTDWTIRLVVINAKLSGRSSYIEIMDSCFGPSGKAAVSFFQFAFAFGGMCAFGIIIGDTIPPAIRSAFPGLSKVPVLSLLTNRQFVIALCTVCVSYPLSLYRDIHKLARASGLALVGMLIIVTAVLVEGPHAPAELKGDPAQRLSVLGPGVVQAIGVISFAFVCHHNSLLIYGSLRTPTLDRFARVTHISTAIALVACCTLAISGYSVFTNKTQGNILNNFSSDDTLINIARFCFGLNMFTTLPLELFVCREVIEQYFFSHETFSIQRHVFFTSTILLSSMLLALVTCDLGVTLEITGGVSATALAYIFPAACYLKLTDPAVPWRSRAKLPAAICLVFGVIVMTVSLFLALGKAWTPEGGAKICS